MTQKVYLAWIDWMKVLGMALIVFGHTGGHTLIPPITHPFNPKQLGVAFFVFVTGFSLASETRPPRSAIAHRLFDVFVLGILVAVVMSGFKLAIEGDLNESNYLPFLFGLNVLDNDFPANPTTWYIGCYIHLLLAWGVVFRKLSVSYLNLAVVVAIEICVRAFILYWQRDYTAYMLFTNWLVIFWMGQLVGRRNCNVDNTLPKNGMRTDVVVPLVGLGMLIAFASIWTRVVGHFDITTKNPFGRIPLTSNLATAMSTSVAITGLYLIYTGVAYRITRVLPHLRAIQFLGRNTLFVFLVHMPLIYGLSPFVYQYFPQGWGRVVCNQILYFLLLAIASHWSISALRLRTLRSKCFSDDSAAN